MASPKEYDPGPLVEAITALDWSTDHPGHAMRAIQETVCKNSADELSDVDAIKLLGRLVERKFIRTRIEKPVLNARETGWAASGRKAKYVRVPENER